MPLTRRNVYSLGGDWADEILWYARAVKAMKQRALAEPTGWLFYGAIHGVHRGLWEHYGFVSPAEPDPDAATQDVYWRQCQHSSWYFLPWHRGYLLALERILRAEIEALGGPHETWALPYWNYFRAGENALPPAFASADWPDGTGDNPLFVEQRYGLVEGEPIVLPPEELELSAMQETEFTGVGSGGAPGFGGVDTGFNHGGGVFGSLESQPHNIVHVLIGGGNANGPGLMSHPATAGLDPIFWLHHANIDRLWECWLEAPGTDGNPDAAAWLQGPASVGQRAFAMPAPDGTRWDYTPEEMRRTAPLGYEYDDLTPGAAPALPEMARTERLGLEDLVLTAGGDMQERVELMGASEGALRLDGAGARQPVRIDPGVRGAVTESLVPGLGSGPPDRVFLNLENVTGTRDHAAYAVYVGVPEGEAPRDHPERRAGTISLFGVTEASEPAGGDGGSGLTFVLEITRIVDEMHLGGGFVADELAVDIVPLASLDGEAEVRVGRIGIYRQGR